jgi:hypothetical protein
MVLNCRHFYVKVNQDIHNMQDSLLSLRQWLLGLGPVGRAGLEGLIAAALAEWTNLTFRLAKSGSQFGRDAMSSPGAFAIAMEAKLYQNAPRLETIISKGLLAGKFLEGSVDLWVLACTAEVGDDVVLKLTQELEDRGISLLVLDWTPTPIPPLALLLAVAEGATVEWFAKNITSVSTDDLAKVLRCIRELPSFEAIKKRFVAVFSSAELGLDAARSKNHEWLREHFKDRRSAQRVFGQYIAVLDPLRPIVIRKVLLQKLDKWIANHETQEMAVVLGSEGVGKSWLVARWWTQLSDPPIFLISSGYFSRSEWMPQNAEEFISQLLASQIEKADRNRAELWHRKIKRWKNRPGGRLKFIVLLDGINETPGRPWADLIKSLAEELKQLGGKLIITCRPEYWHRELQARLFGNVEWIEIEVGDFQDDELSVALKGAVRLQDLSEDVRKLVRNPRVCALARHLFIDAHLRPTDLTVARLFFEYWRHRIQERGDLLGHNADDFEDLLRSHARTLRSANMRLFNRDEWRNHSGLFKRGSQSYLDDITEIEEGRFLRPSRSLKGYYEFREEALPFALGLLTARELQDESVKLGSDAPEVLERILEEVRGFELTSDIMGAAIAVACLDENYPPHLRPILIKTWLELQNVPARAFQEFAANASIRPEAFLDAAELIFSQDRIRRSDWLEAALVSVSKDLHEDRLISARIRKWLGRWSRIPRKGPPGDRAADERFEKNRSYIQMKRDSLAGHEITFFNRVCNEVAHRDEMDLDEVAFKLLIGKRLTPFADAFLGWSLAAHMLREYRRSEADAAWVLRLNCVDYEQTEEALLEASQLILRPDGSEVVRHSVATLLRLIGSEHSTEVANSLSEPPRLERWQRAWDLCSTDPLDPASDFPPNLRNAELLLDSISPNKIWASYFTTEENFNLNTVWNPLIRFNPSVLIEKIHQTVATSTVRSGVELRQLTLHLDEVAPVLRNQELEILRNVYEGVTAGTIEVLPEDQQTILGSLLTGMLPHLSSVKQLEILNKLPQDFPLWFILTTMLKPLSGEDIDRSIINAHVSGDNAKLRRVLWFTAYAKSPVGPSSTDVVLGLVECGDETISILAAETVFQSGNRLLQRRLIEAVETGNIEAPSQELFHQSRAFADAVVQTGRKDLFDLIAPRFRGFAAQIFGAQYLAKVADDIESLVRDQLGSVNLMPLDTAELLIDMVEDELTRTFIGIEETENRSAEDVKAELDALADEHIAMKHWAQRQKYLRGEAEAYLDRLRHAGVPSIVEVPRMNSLEQIARMWPDRLFKWVDWFLQATSKIGLMNARNLGLAIAKAASFKFPEPSRELFKKLWHIRPTVRIVFGSSHISFELALLFLAADQPELNALREQQLDCAVTDQKIEEIVIAAERAGRFNFLDNYVRERTAEAHAGMQARALTVAALRDVNPQSEYVLGSEKVQGGFLAGVRDYCLDIYRRNLWAHHWYEKILSSKDYFDAWRYGELFLGCADRRATIWFVKAPSHQYLELFGEELLQRLAKRVDEKSKKREETLFGQKRPSDALSHFFVSELSEN